MLTTALMLLLACQDNEYVQKLDKVKYNLAVRSCREAERKLDSEETAAIERLTRIIEDPELLKKECSLYIQQTDQYDPPYAFLPYQFRARARISLAGRAKTDADKKLQLEEAVKDLEESLKRNVKSSAAYLDAAKAELRRIAAAPPPPVPAAPVEPTPSLRARQAKLIAENRFKSARLLVDREGAELSAAEREDRAGRAERACANFLTEELRHFRGRLLAIAGIADLRAMTKTEADVTFELPPPAEIAIVHPAFEWARKATEVFRDVGAGRKPGSALLPVATAAAGLEEGGGNPWLKICATLAFQDLQGEVERRVSECAEAPKARRDLLVAELQSLVRTWSDFAGGLDPALRKSAPWIDANATLLAAPLARLPRELVDLDREDLRGCFERFPVEPELQALEERLRKIAAGGGLARESRQKLYTLLVAARATRLFLEGKGEAEVSQGIREDLENLGHVGGAVDPDRYGPRVRKVYDSLR
jgi:hypothetical protein